MEKKVLKETFVLKSTIENPSLIDNKIIENGILTDYTKTTINSFKPNKYNDLSLTYNKNQTWLIEHITDRVHHDFKYSLELLNIFGSLEGYLESSYKRNNVDYNQSNLSSDFTAIYLVKGHGQLIFEFDSNTRGKQEYVLFLKEKDYVFFNSNLDYYFTKNPERDLIRSYLTINFRNV